MFIEYEPPPEIYRGSLGLLSGRRDIAQFPNQDILSDRQKGKGLRFGLPISKVRDIITTNVKLPGHGPELPGKVISFHIVPLDPAATAGLAEARFGQQVYVFCLNLWSGEHDEPGGYAEDRCLRAMDSMDMSDKTYEK
jgi:hypothetical protein